ncbi:MAG: sulfatase-like hydrolase/transferase [Clostridia bacterium]|nr:sulfatase-like hydrolase/transferase [Clostridia bacterium]
MKKISSFLICFKNKINSITLIKSFAGKIKTYAELHPYKLHLHISLFLALFVVITVQSFECFSIFGGFTFIFKNTYFFIINYLIVFLILATAFFFRRRVVLLSLYTILWTVLGLANFIVMLHRPMPIAAIDFVVMTTTMDIIPHYFSVFHIILCAVGIVAFISLFTYLFIKSKKHICNFKQAISPFACSAILLFIFLFGGSLTGNLKVSYNDVNAAYNNHGFIYCFTSSFLAKGISKPADYSSNNITDILSKYENVKSEKTIKPNIIVLQLESFLDTSKYEKYPLKSDPIPNFHKICEQFGEGSLVVPSNGGGTVNTEFEVLTGMNLEFFGTIEYPYTTVLKNKTCESAAYILDENGYTSHAIHNHTGVFYARDQVYPNLGFDTFIPIEFMQYEKTETGWAKDTAILQSIRESLESTPGTDFIFAVTVQGHGAYSSEDNSKLPYKIKGKENLSGSDFRKASMYEYYCNLLSETDAVIGELFDYVMNSNEEFVVVLYGDHLPSLDFDSELYEYQSDYMTTYTVFSNITDKFSYEFTHELPSYRLMSTLFEELGIDNGIINKINRRYTDADYESSLKDIQYDMLYGKGFSYNGKPYERKDIQFGCNKIVINSVVYNDGFLTLRGENFTKESEININGRERETGFVDSSTIVCACSEIDQEDIISVCQTAVDGKKLHEIFYTPDN